MVKVDVQGSGLSIAFPFQEPVRSRSAKGEIQGA